MEYTDAISGAHEPIGKCEVFPNPNRPELPPVLGGAYDKNGGWSNNKPELVAMADRPGDIYNKPNSSPLFIREFETGATRSSNDGKPDFEGYLSPIVIERFGEYMVKHQYQSNGELRPSDNWQKGIPKKEYLKSAFRHFMDVWMYNRGKVGRETLEDSLCALLFNVMGYLHETLKERKYKEEQA